ncbi:MAG: hypothetical protein ABJA86_00135 [Nocardioidaceae bacterium]
MTVMVPPLMAPGIGAAGALADMSMNFPAAPLGPLGWLVGFSVVLEPPPPQAATAIIATADAAITGFFQRIG